MFLFTLGASGWALTKVNFWRSQGDRVGFPSSAQGGSGQGPREGLPPLGSPKRVSRALSIASLRDASLLTWLSLSLRFTSLSLCLTSLFTSLRIPNQTKSNLEPHTPTGSAYIHIYIHIEIYSRGTVQEQPWFQQVCFLI